MRMDAKQAKALTKEGASNRKTKENEANIKLGKKAIREIKRDIKRSVKAGYMQTRWSYGNVLAQKIDPVVRNAIAEYFKELGYEIGINTDHTQIEIKWGK